MEYKIFLGIAATTIGFLSYIPYLRDTILKRTRPHVFSWLVWSLFAGIGFTAQMMTGGGSGAWVTGMTAVMCLAIAMMGLASGRDHIIPIDFYCFFGALLGIILWRITDNPLTAVLLISIIDLLAFAPTFRKAYSKPNEETAVTFFFAALKWLLGIIALQSYSLTTWLYPATLVLTNGAFVTMLMVRRRQLHSPKKI